MQYTQFEIVNYRGIERAILEIPPAKGSRVVTLIGLNESGKTTILEAIYSFSPDSETKALYENTVLLSDDPAYYIPRANFSNFNDNITVKASVCWEDDEIEAAIAKVKYEKGIDVNIKSIPKQFSITNTRHYTNSKMTSKIAQWDISPIIRTGRQKLYRTPTHAERTAVLSVFLRRLPRIAYFPTFVFNFPQRIYLKGGPDQPLNRFYKGIFQAILDAGKSGHTIEKHIVERYEEVLSATPMTKVIDAAAAMMGARSSYEMIKQTVDKAADTVSDLIISKWDEIFPHSPLKKEISIEPFDGLEEYTDDDGEKQTRHVVWVEFKVRDSGNRYNIADRSLGFRWFFCFLLFTKFLGGKEGRGMVFLFDEPASNLHAKAQEKLLESFSEISVFPNSLLFSTHSHYMVEPLWLERAYVVKNDAIDYSDAGGERAAIIYLTYQRGDHILGVSKGPQDVRPHQPHLQRRQQGPRTSGSAALAARSRLPALRLARRHHQASGQVDPSRRPQVQRLP